LQIHLTINPTIRISHTKTQSKPSQKQGEGIMKGLLSLVILVLDIIAIIDVIKGSMDTVKKVLWIVLIILLPVIGLILYYLLGRK
jgi:hypothetical protein